MEVVDQTDGIKTEKVEDEVSFMLTNNSGGYCLMSHYPKSRFEGVYFREKNHVYKAIDSLRISSPIKKLVNRLWSVSRERADATEEFFMPLYSNSLVYELSAKSEFDLILDCKESYDNREWGRSYEISKESGCLVIKFSKRNDGKDDNAKFNREFDIYTAVYSEDLEFRQAEQWEKVFYEVDKERDSLPFERFVFNACKIRCSCAVFSFSTQKSSAVAEAKYVWKKRESLKKEKEKHVSEIIHAKAIKDNEVGVAYQCSINAIDSLKVNDLGICAGLPWFFQFWARDELISLKSMINMEKFAFVKKILFKNLELVGPDGKMDAKEMEPDLKSADAVLWLFKRFEGFIDALNSRGLLHKYMSKSDMEKVMLKLSIVVSQWMKYYTRNGLVVNGPKETWMDTDSGGDSRDGARIEMQALFLSCLRFLRKMGRPEPFEQQLAKNVKGAFFRDGIIYDGENDPTIRPNAFIAAYLYPELAGSKEWVSCFSNMIPKLWLNWGGLSTIDKSNKLYTSKYTGENPKSYHRGDSWFWVNNIAAIALHRLDRKRFAKYIEKILRADITEILYTGVTGYSSELSSAVELRGDGCFCQTWSSSTFIELVDEIY